MPLSCRELKSPSEPSILKQKWSGEEPVGPACKMHPSPQHSSGTPSNQAPLEGAGKSPCLPSEQPCVLNPVAQGLPWGPSPCSGNISLASPTAARKRAHVSHSEARQNTRAPTCISVITFSISVSVGTGLAMQKQLPRQWELGAASVLGCRSARIKYSNTSLTECVKQFYIKQFLREGLCEFFFESRTVLWKPYQDCKTWQRRAAKAMCVQQKRTMWNLLQEIIQNVS